MEFTALPQSIQGFIDSIVPALIKLAGLVLLFAYFCGFGPLARYLQLAIEKLDLVKDAAKNELVKESGLLKLLPVGVLVLVLLCALVIDRAITGMGAALPGQLRYTQPDTLINSAPRETLAKLWSLYPGADDEHTLYLVLDRELARLSGLSGRETPLPWKHHEDAFSSTARLLAALKVYMLLALAFIAIGLRLRIQKRRLLLRYSFVVFAFAGFATHLVFGQIESLKQSEWAKANYVLASRIATDEKMGERLDASKTAAYKSRLEEFTARQKTFGAVPFYLGW